MLRGVLTVGGWTMASRILGFARDMLIAACLAPARWPMRSSSR